MKFLSFLFSAIQVFLKTVAIFLPSFLVFLVLTQPNIWANHGNPVFSVVADNPVHEILPNTTWEHLKPCGIYFNEKEEFDRALQCVNERVWPESPVSEETTIPRCFIVSTSSPDVMRFPDHPFNAIPIITIFGAGLVVGVYQPETHTVFVVENEDAAATYRHELQHLFLHIHDPETGGGGHHQPIWEKCEPPYYEPSAKNKLIDAIRDLDE